MTAFEINQAFAEILRIYQVPDFERALEALQELLAHHPRGEPNWFALLGNIRFKLGLKEQAGDAFVREAGISPDKAAPFVKLAIALYAQCGASGKIHDLAPTAIKHLSGDAATMHAVGEACLAAGDIDRLASLLHHLDPLTPQHVALKFAYYKQVGNREKAWETLTDGVRDCPNDLYLRATRYAEARTICDFDAMREYEALMEAPDRPLASALLSGEMALSRLFWARSEALIARPSYDSNRLLQATEALSMLRHPRRAISATGRRLKIAYLSGDFYQHAVMSVFSEALCEHDPDAIDLTLLCHSPADARSWQQRNWPAHLREAVVPIHDRPTVEVLDIIRHREIDILVDLKGHTIDARLDVINLSDVPLKVSYLGYPATVTATELDYAITDRFITPDASRAFYSEKLCLLPHTSMPNNSLKTCSPQPARRADHGLPEDAFIFCSFNAVFKISPQTLKLWARVLFMVPEAILWIRCDGDLPRRNLLKALHGAGIARDRIHFAEAVASYQAHIDRVALADLSLDTMPYNGHATTTDMLRAGVPVVALRGTTSPSRMSEGLLNAVGLNDLVAADEDGFTAIAATLGLDRDLHRAVRERLWRNRFESPLFNPRMFARHLELAYQMMAERCRLGLAPDHLVVPALAAPADRQEEAA